MLSLLNAFQIEQWLTLSIALLQQRSHIVKGHIQRSIELSVFFYDLVESLNVVCCSETSSKSSACSIYMILFSIYITKEFVDRVESRLIGL